ncbi:UNVERIFIED_CONTAM: hypothetical protein RMT77_006134 [Armadillidium vulgare]
MQSLSEAHEPQLRNTCSEEASLAGDNTKVISYCFSNADPKYSNGFNESLNNISIFYPDWLVRVYANEKDIRFLQSKITPRKFLYYCDVNKLPYPLNGSLEGVPVRMWRFAAMGDSNIDVLLFRDTDSMVIKREYDAVQEWLKSNKTLHIMRDHPYHDRIIMAGMFGVKMNDTNRKELEKLRDKMFKLGKGKTDKERDQTLLKKIFWPKFKKDFLAHDSYHCRKYKGSLPFPSKRDGRMIATHRFHGKVDSVWSQCPIYCRPKNHRDWKYC